METSRRINESLDFADSLTTACYGATIRTDDAGMVQDCIWVRAEASRRSGGSGRRTGACASSRP